MLSNVLQMCLVLISWKSPNNRNLIIFFWLQLILFEILLSIHQSNLVMYLTKLECDAILTKRQIWYSIQLKSCV